MQGSQIVADLNFPVMQLKASLVCGNNLLIVVDDYFVCIGFNANHLAY